MKEIVSVLMPVFKTCYLSKAILSILNQTVSDFELIIVNDKSPEDVDTIVSSFCDSRIRYYTNEENIGNKDIVANWNKCLSYAKGEYFCLICDDDCYAPTFLEEMLRLAKQYPQCNVFRSGVQIVDKAENVYDYYPSSPEWECSEDYMWHVFRGYRCQTVSEWFYRRQPIVDLGGYVSLPLAWYSDFLTTFKLSLKGGIVSTSKHLVSFRMSGENITSQLDSRSRVKMESSRLFEVEVNKIIADNHFEKADILYSLLSKYMKEKRSFVLGTCKLADVWYFYNNRNRYNITIKMIIKSFFYRVIR